MFIGGQRRDATDGATMSVVDPATGQQIARIEATLRAGITQINGWA